MTHPARRSLPCRARYRATLPVDTMGRRAQPHRPRGVQALSIELSLRTGRRMNRIINNPDQVVEDMLRGYLRVHGDLVSGTDNPRVVRAARAPIRGKVGVVTGGGSGHEPAFPGYVGNDVVDADAVGAIVSSATAHRFDAACSAAAAGKR